MHGGGVVTLAPAQIPPSTENSGRESPQVFVTGNPGKWRSGLRQPGRISFVHQEGMKRQEQLDIEIESRLVYSSNHKNITHLRMRLI